MATNNRNRRADLTLTQCRLRQLLHYEPDTGVFTRIVSTTNLARSGDIAGTTGSLGYVTIGIDYGLYLGHRLAWLYMTGQWPEFHIDHINRVRSDNRWANLRPSTKAENMRNMVRPKSNTSGYKGVSWDRSKQKWHAYIRDASGKRRHLGRFATAEEAARVYDMAAIQFHGEFACLNFHTTAR